MTKVLKGGGDQAGRSLDEMSGSSSFIDDLIHSNRPKTFNGVVKRAIAESQLLTKAKLAKQILEDQESRVNSVEPIERNSIQFGTTKRFVDVATKTNVVRTTNDRASSSTDRDVQFNSAGKKLWNSSNQADFPTDKPKKTSVREIGLQQLSQIGKSINKFKKAFGPKSRFGSAKDESAPLLMSAYGSKSDHREPPLKPALLTKPKVTTTPKMSSALKVTSSGGTKDSSSKSLVKPVLPASLQTFAGSKMIRETSITSDLPSGVSEHESMETKIISMEEESLSSELRGTGTKNNEPSDKEKYLMKFAQKQTSLEGIGKQKKPSKLKTPSVMPTQILKGASPSESRQTSLPKRLSQRPSGGSKNLIEISKGVDSNLNRMFEFCSCPDVELQGEEKKSEIKFDFGSFKMNDENLPGGRPKIISVTRSPHERKDRKARAAFVKELEQMEISAIERKQRFKPRKIKKDLKKEGVYDTIKYVCQIPDSYPGSVRGSQSRHSVETGDFEEKEAAGRADSEPSVRSTSSLIEDKIQLRKDTSMGSRTTAGDLNKEDAFHEIELSEESNSSLSSRSESISSGCEVISSSSEISLRVNLDRTPTLKERKAMKLETAPFVKYQQRINGEKVLAERNKSKMKIVDANLEGIIIEKIATEFGIWAKENGVKPEAVEKDVIKELFQFGTMDTAANSIAVEIKELIIVPECITDGLYPELEERAAMYRQILFDEGAYWRTERSMAFGKPDPKPYKRPPNPPLPSWMKSGFVPQPLVTGELLYQTLIDNDSLMLERYVLWMIENPKYYRPPFLLNCGYFQNVIDKHGGSEEAIRQKSAHAKSMAAQAGKNMAGLNYGMTQDLKKLKEMSEAGGKK